MDVWDECLYDEEIADRIKLMIDGQSLILFFKKDGDIYGAPEESRVVFARMKKPDEDTSKDWVDEAQFIAINLSRSIMGDRSQHMFGKKDLKAIQVIDKDDAEKMLTKAAKKGTVHDNPLRQLFALSLGRHDRSRDNADNMIQIKDKK